LPLSRQEFYSIIGALGVVGVGWVVQLFGLPWEVIALALVVLAWGFTPRIMHNIRSWKTPKSVQFFQTFLGGDELLRELKRMEDACARLSGSLSVSDRYARTQIMELDHLWLALSDLKGKYTDTWTLNLQNRVTMVRDELKGASSALGDRNVEHAEVHIDGAIQEAKSLIAYLKSPPQVNSPKNQPLPPVKLPEPALKPRPAPENN